MFAVLIATGHKIIQHTLSFRTAEVPSYVGKSTIQGVAIK
jgi:hypothetical protein